MPSSLASSKYHQVRLLNQLNHFRLAVHPMIPLCHLQYVYVVPVALSVSKHVLDIA